MSLAIMILQSKPVDWCKWYDVFIFHMSLWRPFPLLAFHQQVAIQWQTPSHNQDWTCQMKEKGLLYQQKAHWITFRVNSCAAVLGWSIWYQVVNFIFVEYNPSSKKMWSSLPAGFAAASYKVMIGSLFSCIRLEYSSNSTLWERIEKIPWWTRPWSQYRISWLHLHQSWPGRTWSSCGHHWIWPF